MKEKEIKEMMNDLEKIKRYLEYVLEIKFEIILEPGLGPNISACTYGQQVFVSEDWLRELDDKLELIPMLAHEAFHVWQLEAVFNCLVEEELRKKWQYEIATYRDIREGFCKLWNQSIERTATIFSNIIAEKVIGCSLEKSVTEMFNKEEINFVNSLNFDYVF